MTRESRERLFYEIARSALVGIGLVDETSIDRLNIHRASLLAMKRAVLALSRTPDFLLIDGACTIDLPLVQKSGVSGVAKSASIAAASVIAKVHRDALMERLDRMYPGYAFAEHKGYGTPEHLRAIKEKGPTPVHRKSFSPVLQILQAEFAFQTEASE
jgi:ribonuclease HII